jgi:hypothetical protein
MTNYKLFLLNIKKRNAVYFTLLFFDMAWTMMMTET